MITTKRVNTYGKRSSRIVYASTGNKTSLESPVKQPDENIVLDSPSSPKKLLRWGRKVKGHSTSPRGSPKAGNIFRLASKKAVCSDGAGNTPQRQPLGLKSSSIRTSPSIVYLGTRTPQVAQKPTAFTPFVDSDIIIIQEEPPKPKKQSSKPKRSTKLTEITNNVSTTEEEQPIRAPRQRKTKRPIVVSDNESEDTDDERDSLKDHSLPVSNLGLQQAPIFISDDDEDSDSEFLPNISRPNYKKNSIDKRLPPPPKPSQPRRPPRRAASLRKELQKGRIARKEQLHVDSPLTEIEESSISLKDTWNSKRGSQHYKNSLPSELQYLSEILAECSQKTPQNFDSLIESFPTHEIFGTHPPTNLAFRKLGEASYSEVFTIGDIVLKIIPLRNETAPQVANADIDLPCESDCKDVLQEIIVTRELGKVCPGFIKLLRTFIVVGDYPPQLLALWDEFNSQKESENIRPDVFPRSQAYALLVLPNGGPDLESYRFPLKVAWRQACSVFWQTAKALAIAEELASFEHRDLHWGQILVKSTGHSSPKRRSKQQEMLPMDHPLLGISVTIIDMGLARMDAINAKDKVYWTPFDDVIFDGEGDYQFDVYRMMKVAHSDGCWDKFRPVTNVMWLHYLIVKLLRAKGMRPPSIRNIIPGTNEFNERICYDSLVEMESILEGSIMFSRGKKNRNDMTRLTFSNAGELVRFAREKGWLI